jgi:hypothetical protein
MIGPTGRAGPSQAANATVSGEALPLIGRLCPPVFVGAVPEWKLCLDAHEAQPDAVIRPLANQLLIIDLAQSDNPVAVHKV